MGLWLFARPVACRVSILPLCPPPSNVTVSVQIQEDSILGPCWLYWGRGIGFCWVGQAEGLSA